MSTKDKKGENTKNSLISLLNYCIDDDLIESTQGCGRIDYGLWSWLNPL